MLSRRTSGVLALLGDGGWPYAVPLSYAFDGEKLYFHCAREGHKLDAIRREARASFCVVDRDEVVPAEYTTYFRSAIAFGRVRVIEDEVQKRAAAISRRTALKIAIAPSSANGRGCACWKWTSNI